MEYKNIEVKIEKGIATITINRPKALNALNTETLEELENVLEVLQNDDGVKVIVITGAGEKAFVAGADISEMKDMSVFEAKKFAELGQKVFRKIELVKKPVIAAVNGYALGGGCELALACDIRIASRNAKFGQPEVGLGIIPGFGGTQRLPRIVGVSKAKELIYTGDMIDAEEALRIGLISKVVEQDKLLEEAYGIAKKIMSKGLVAVSLAKEAINKSLEVDIDSGMEYEANAFAMCFGTQDQKEGMAAFLEKRAPKFEGR
ncbi:enoyl-CoA hydratase [Caldanaerobacter subterraneus subsp. tengcongensis MB4]|uniref:short-chain-enoyl-CoA hydratase n=1 Tax=Caldanaerobacter subterraneus subsp. tengcongensis (strain DSM 15242 / JCM 11007 / NBRC 100824 / MB4) TaxID=273068 RepID=Q8RC92_CALS4|nr:short-chain-enoyl-CoA hydratase [Caldanaerobacter subterraneus]AAM23820.1 Enoyl-CoA hydratase/carnithine racemase [Caldanaerobacter subterraneus subsp. tengcongensis MB4]MCS3916680.1 enoyl-CoA hydratase [Caldanaerobacter subterraneus subsp. tengcongensis MB4]